MLFLDDDIIPHSALVEAHASASEKTGAALVAGRVVQPWPTLMDRSYLGCGTYRNGLGAAASRARDDT